MIDREERLLRGPGRRLGPLFACLALAVLVPESAPAQVMDTCVDGRISEVFVDNHSVFDLSSPDLGGRLAWAYRTANKLHARTRETVIRRELLFSEGDCYSVDRLRDSERLLRGLPFIADVDVFGLRQPDGTVHVVVDTQDEWSTRIDPKVGSSGLEGLRVREDNLLGTGQQVSAFYVDDREEQVYGFSYRSPQFLGTRVDGAMDAGRTPVGYLLAQSLRYPFVGEVGRWAYTQAMLHHDHYFQYVIPAEEGVVAAWYPQRRQSVELGAAYRWGGRGFNRTMFGAALAGEWLAYPSEPRYADDDLMVTGAVPPPLPRDSVSSVRAVLMTGQRNVYYVRRHALDTIDGTEDVRLGVEADIAIAPSIPGVSHDRDLALDLGLFAASEFVPRLLAGMTVAVEARRRYDSPATEPEWTDVFGMLDGWAYWKPSPESRRTVVGSVSAAAGWHDRVPFQLTMGARTGLRGHADHVYAGGRRVVATVEHRSYLGWPLPELFDAAGVAFLDVGKMWAGDAPFGVDSPVRAGAGVGVRLAFPPGSRQTLRVDVGIQLHAGLALREVQVSIGMGQLVGRLVSDREGQLGRSLRVGPSALLLVPEHR